jgi:HEAT repeat protein
VNLQTSSRRSLVIPRALSSRASRVLRLALRSLPPRVQRIGRRAMNPVVKRWPTVAALLGLVPEHRAPPPRAAAETPLPPVIAALCAALRDPSAEVAAEAADALRHHHDQEAIAALSSVVDNADGYFAGGVRAAAIRSLSAILPYGRGQPILAAVADADVEVSVAAIAGIVDRNEPGGGDALFAVLENPRGYYVSLTRSAAARGMRRLVTPPDAARLRALLESENDREVREALRSLIGEA